MTDGKSYEEVKTNRHKLLTKEIATTSSWGFRAVLLRIRNSTFNVIKKKNKTINASDSCLLFLDMWRRCR